MALRSGVWEDEFGERRWFRNGELHREDGPAFEGRYHRRWHRNDKLHRDDGPAIERSNGTREWWVNGIWHREDGPAVEYIDGTCRWWLNGVEYTKEEFEQELLARKWGLSVDA